MADQSLQAFQLGASLFDRAQTQARMMEQFKLQQAESVLQQQGLAIQNQMRDIQLADAIKNQRQLLDDTKNMDTNVKLVDEFYSDPTKPFPTFLPVSAPQNKAILNQYRQQLDDYSVRSRLMKGAQQTQQIVGNQLADAISFANKNGLHDVVWQNNNGLNEYGQIDFNKSKTILDAIAPKMAEKTAFDVAAQTASKIAAAATAGPEAIDMMVTAGKMTPQEAEMAKAAYSSKQISKSPLTAALADWQRAPEDQKDAKFQILKAAASKAGQDVVVGPSGEFEFRKALPQQVQTQLFNGIKSANAAIDILEKVNPKDIEDAFSISGAFRQGGQAIGLAKVGLGLSESQGRIRRTLRSLEPLVAKGLLSETGRLTDQDAVRARQLIAEGFATSSSDQVKQAISELKGLFQNAKNRMKSPFEGVIGEAEVQKVDTRPPAEMKSQQTSAQDVFSSLKKEPVFQSVEEAEKSVPSGTKYRVGNKFYIKD